LLKDHVVVKVKVNTKKFGKLKIRWLDYGAYAFHCVALHRISFYILLRETALSCF
jgi:hypothetical protein